MIFDSLGTGDRGTRRLRYAIIASLLLHLLILWPAASRLLNKDAPARLQATLRWLPPPAVKPVPRAAAVAPLRAPIPEPILPRPLAPVLEPSRPASVPPAADAMAKASAASEPAASASAAAPAPAASLSSGAVLSDASAAGEAVDGLRAYRLALASQARRFKRYPPQAMASAWEGSADIRVEVGGDGRPHPATLVRSSGRDLLDQAALAMVDAGALRARLPDSLRGRSFAVVLPVVFNLED